MTKSQILQSPLLISRTAFVLGKLPQIAARCKDELGTAKRLINMTLINMTINMTLDKKLYFW